MPRASHEMDLDSFLGHRGSAGGSTGYLEKWKDDGEIDIFLHPHAGIAALWGHGWYRIADYEKKGEQIVEVRSSRQNCLESEAVLTRQRYRDKEDRRETPPVVCPFCIALEHVRDLVNDGKLDWCAPIFTFEVPDDPSQDATILHAGGWCGLIGSKDKKDYSKEEIGELRRAGIQLNEVFREEGAARLQYLFSVITVADPDQGCVLTFEAQSLGDAMKKEIRKQIMAHKEKGDPRVNPYAFRWLFDANKQFAAKYDVAPMPETEITAAVREVMNQPPPSIAEHVLPLNVRLLRASMEEHCEIELPWDDIFGPAMEIADELEAEAKEAGAHRDDASTSFSFGANAPASGGHENADSSDEEVECAHCQGVMLASESVCKNCGATYLPDGSMVPPKAKDPDPPAKPALRSRAAIAAARTAQAPAAAPPPPSPAPGGEAAPKSTFRSARRRAAG